MALNDNNMISRQPLFAKACALNDVQHALYDLISLNKMTGNAILSLINILIPYCNSTLNCTALHLPCEAIQNWSRWFGSGQTWRIPASAPPPTSPSMTSQNPSSHEISKCVIRRQGKKKNRDLTRRRNNNKASFSRFTHFFFFFFLPAPQGITHHVSHRTHLSKRRHGRSA